MKVLLVCSGGMSSAIVVKAIEKEAAKQKIEISVKSVGTGEFADEIKNGWDVVLVAPQVRHRFDYFCDVAAETNTKIAIIPPQGYSPLGGPTIIKELREILY